MTYEMLGRWFSEEEWESICSRCGLCCYEKYERDDGTIEFTNTPCRYLSRENTCKVYPYRLKVCDDCCEVTPKVVLRGDLLPPECTYVQLAAQLKTELTERLEAESPPEEASGRGGRWFRRWSERSGRSGARDEDRPGREQAGRRRR